MVAIGFTRIPASLVLPGPIGEHQLKCKGKQNRLHVNTTPDSPLRVPLNPVPRNSRLWRRASVNEGLLASVAVGWIGRLLRRDRLEGPCNVIVSTTDFYLADLSQLLHNVVSLVITYNKVQYITIPRRLITSWDTDSGDTDFVLCVCILIKDHYLGRVAIRRLL